MTFNNDGIAAIPSLIGVYARIVAELLGIRVTDWGRSDEENTRVGGHPNSFHLYRRGALALDFAADTPKEKVDQFVKLTGWEVVDERTAWGTGSGPHWHTEHDGPDKGRAIVGSLAMASVVGGMLVVATKG